MVVLADLVFPTPVGVFLMMDAHVKAYYGLPHARGGVSNPALYLGRRLRGGTPDGSVRGLHLSHYKSMIYIFYFA